MNSPSHPFSQPPCYEAAIGSPSVHIPASPFTLVPTLASTNNRYARTYTVETSTLTISAKNWQTDLDSYSTLPTGWHEYYHPEGAPVFFFSDGTYHAVTDNSVRDPHTLSHLESCLYEIFGRVKRANMALPPGWLVCLTLDFETSSCNFYLVNHAKKTLCWPEDVEMSDIGLAETSSPLQLYHALNEQYWIHAEFFPFHIPNISTGTEEIVDFLTFGRSDQLTSDSSTFPYDAAQCQAFLEMIRTSKHEGAHWTWTVARLSTIIARHKVDTFFGEQYARISREQRRLGSLEYSTNLIIIVLNAALFRTPDYLNNQLANLHVDGIVYTVHWRRFINSRLSDWRDALLCTTGTLLVMFASLNYYPEGPSHYAGLTGAIFAVVGMLLSSILLQKYSGTQEQHAADVIGHVQDLNHPKWGYQLSAILFSLPRALQAWTLASLFAQIVLMIVPPSILMLVCAAAAIIVLATGALSAVYAIGSRIWKAGACVPQFFSAFGCANLSGSISMV